MRYKLLGKSGLRVSELCLGTMTFGDVWQDWGLATPNDECRKIFDGFAAAGGNFIDTAFDFYEPAGSRRRCSTCPANRADRLERQEFI